MYIYIYIYIHTHYYYTYIRELADLLCLLCQRRTIHIVPVDISVLCHIMAYSNMLGILYHGIAYYIIL